MLVSENTLGANSYCKWINMGNNNWQWVCRSGQGGGNKVTGKGAQLLGAQILTPAQISAMSIQGLQNIIASHQQRIDEIDRRVIYEQGLMYPWDESTKQMWLAEKRNLLANIAAITAWIALPSNKKATTNGANFIRQQTASYLNTINKVTNGYDPGGNIVNDVEEVLSQNIAGIPVWGVVLLGGAAAYMLLGKKKKTK